MPTIDSHSAHAEYDRILDVIEEMDARLGGQYDPVLDDLQWEAAAFRWQLCHP
jgi:hypothetical protein